MNYARYDPTARAFRRAFSCPRSLAVLAILFASFGCNSFSSGRHYTMAKVDRQNHLIEVRRLLETPPGLDGPNDALDEKVDGALRIVLNGGFLRYVQAIERVELVVFSKVTVRRATETEGFVFQSVYLSSEDGQANISLNESSSLPRLDVDLLPAMEYEGETILVEIRIIELDQEDNQRYRQLINAAASTAAVASPESAAGISVFQTVLTFLTENNTDDIEFNFDFQLAPNNRSTVEGSSDNDRHDIVLQPRIGTYAVIKTEDPLRMNFPPHYFGLIGEGLRWILAHTLRVATLGVIDWCPSAPNPYPVSRYARLFGNPFGIDTGSWKEPVFNRHGNLSPNPYFLGSTDYKFQQGDKWYKFGFDVTEISPFLLKNYDLNHAVGDGFTPYRDQSFLILSIVAADVGISYDEMRRVADTQREVDDLGIRTTQLSPEEFGAGVEAVAQSVKHLAIERRIRKKYGTALANAKSADEIAEIKKGLRTELESLADRKLLSPEVRDGLETRFNRRAERARSHVDRFTVSPQFLLLDGRKKEITIENSFGLEIQGVYFYDESKGEFESLKSKRLDTVPENKKGRIRYAVIKDLPKDAGEYRLLVKTTDRHTMRPLYFDLAAEIEKVELQGENVTVPAVPGPIEWESGSELRVVVRNDRHLREFLIEYTTAGSEKLKTRRNSVLKKDGTGAYVFSFRGETRKVQKIRAVFPGELPEAVWPAATAEVTVTDTVPADPDADSVEAADPDTDTVPAEPIADPVDRP